MDWPPALDDLRMAAAIIAPHIHRTPVLTSATLNAMAGAELHFKCENFQRGGSFKLRGASFAVLSLDDQAVANGVATHSSGNHGAALALAAGLRQVPAYVVMPRTVPAVKQAAVRSYGAEITLCEPTQESREATLAEVLGRTGATSIHPSNDAAIIAGQATVGLELLDEVRRLEIILVPVGGGGLASGVALAVSQLSPATRVVGVEPANADDAQRSLAAGRIIPADNPQTVADGLRTSLGNLTFEILSSLEVEIVTVGEEAIISAMRKVWERLKIVIEPSAATAVAAALEGAVDVKGKRVGIILSGGNVDLDALPWR